LKTALPDTPRDGGITPARLALTLTCRAAASKKILLRMLPNHNLDILKPLATPRRVQRI
jgi:hypothetical protein